MSEDESLRAMVSRIDERTAGMKSDIKELKSQHGDIRQKLSENTAALHQKMEDGYVTEKTFKESQKTTDAKLTGHKRWLSYLSAFAMAIAAAATGSYFKH